MHKQSRYLFFGICIILSLTQCYYDSEEVLYPSLYNNCDTIEVSFTNDILPIMNQHCNAAGCHNSNDKGGGYILDTYAGTLLSANDGSLVGCLTGEKSFASMPLGGDQLDYCTINQIKAWVNDGAKNN